MEPRSIRLRVRTLELQTPGVCACCLDEADKTCSGRDEPIHVLGHDGEGWELRVENPAYAEQLLELNGREVEILAGLR